MYYLKEMIDFVNCQFKNAELTPTEREKLYRWIYNIRPHKILEIGTGSGGSTTYMAQAALDSNNSCTIYTCDPRRKPIPLFFKLYPFVRFYNTTSDIFTSKLDRIHFNFIFFDGPDNPHIAINDLIFLEKNMRKGTYFSMHDWDCNKAIRVRSYLQKADNWQRIEVIGKEEESVGLCLYKFLG